jgi:mono/diheme cytochrome c family protein
VLCVVAISLPSASLARQSSKKPGAKSSPVSDGASLYKRNCAVCHGDDAKGGSAPDSKLFTQPAPDLTTLSKRHDGKFPGEYVSIVLRSGAKVPDHGPAEMPVWGTIFKASAKSDQAQVNKRISALVAYLESIQLK